MQITYPPMVVIKRAVDHGEYSLSKGFHLYLFTAGWQSVMQRPATSDTLV